MHASFNELLKLRDHGLTADPALAHHVRGCAQCTEQLVQLTSHTEGLRRLPDRWAAPDRWTAIREALAAPAAASSPARVRPGWWLPAASAAAVVVAVLFTFQPRTPADIAEEHAAQEGGNAAGSEEARIVPKRPSAAGLIEESQRLEQLLAGFPQAPRVVRAGTAITVADLEDRIHWVDYRLNLGAEAGLDSDQARRLWRERVELLNSLVAVRYAEARSLVF